MLSCSFPAVGSVIFLTQKDFFRVPQVPRAGPCKVGDPGNKGFSDRFAICANLNLPQQCRPRSPRFTLTKRWWRRRVGVLFVWRIFATRQWFLYRASLRDALSRIICFTVTVSEDGLILKDTTAGLAAVPYAVSSSDIFL